MTSLGSGRNSDFGAVSGITITPVVFARNPTPVSYSESDSSASFTHDATHHCHGVQVRFREKDVLRTCTTSNISLLILLRLLNPRDPREETAPPRAALVLRQITVPRILFCRSRDSSHGLMTEIDHGIKREYRVQYILLSLVTNRSLVDKPLFRSPVLCVHYLA